jgi:hypothetical protein
MSDRKNESEDIETAQKNQKKIGAAENDPETSGPAENLREEAAEMVDEEERFKRTCLIPSFFKQSKNFFYFCTQVNVLCYYKA